MGNEFKGAGAVKCGRCDGTGVCRTCEGDGSRKPTPAYLEKRRLMIEAAEKDDPSFFNHEGVLAQVKAQWPEQWMPCNACKSQTGICPGCNGHGWIKVEPSTFGRSSDE